MSAEGRVMVVPAVCAPRRRAQTKARHEAQQGRNSCATIPPPDRPVVGLAVLLLLLAVGVVVEEHVLVRGEQLEVQAVDVVPRDAARGQHGLLGDADAERVDGLLAALQRTEEHRRGVR